MLKRVHDKTDFELVFVIPNLFRDLGVGFREFRFNAPPCDQGSLFGWFHLFCFRLADAKVGKLDLRFLGKLGGC